MCRGRRRKVALELVVPLPRQPAGPPDLPAEIEVDRGDEDRPDDQGVQQDAERHREPELGQEDQGDGPEHEERRREDESGGGDHASGGGERDEGTGPRSARERLLTHSCHEEDVVVEAERHQEDEREEREARV